ncbi:adhesin, partial [Salmonella enterica subsp. enterica serovar Poona]
MKIYSALLLAGTALFFPHPALATVCRNSNGTVTDIFYDLSDVFTSGNNQPGQVVT